MSLARKYKMTYEEALERVIYLAGRFVDGEGSEEEIVTRKDSEAIEIVEELKDNIDLIL